MMLESTENGPLVYPTIEENSAIRPKNYAELFEQEKLQDNYDVYATNMVLQGLHPDVHPPPSVPQNAYHSPSISQQPPVKFPQVDSGLTVLVFLLGMNSSTEASGSKPRSNTKKDRIPQTSSSNKEKNKVEDHPRIAKSSLNNMIVFLKQSTVKRNKKKNSWKTVGKVFTDIRYRWKPIGRTFIIVGNACPLT
nr:hypothetical protein [Tanacetum cinerariifolium]